MCECAFCIYPRSFSTIISCTQIFYIKVWCSTHMSVLSTEYYLINSKIQFKIYKTVKLSLFKCLPVPYILYKLSPWTVTTNVRKSSLPLSSVPLQVLMNKVLKTPHDPYVTIDDTFWPPYIEMLLRYGIAVRHQENNFKIRLETFF